MYRYLHDQTLRLMSHGLTPNEIADEVAMPLSLETAWHTRPYYGALAHNVRSIYVHYMGPLRRKSRQSESVDASIRGPQVY